MEEGQQFKTVLIAALIIKDIQSESIIGNLFRPTQRPIIGVIVYKPPNKISGQIGEVEFAPK